MPTQILATGTTAADSSDVVIGEGEQLTVALKDVAGPKLARGARISIQLKDDAGQYFEVDRLSVSKPAVVIAAAGTYRFSRVAGTSAGVFSG